MKFRIFLFFLFTHSFSYAQDAKQILEGAKIKCQSITGGDFQYTQRMKYLSGQDTSTTYFDLSFTKIKSENVPGDFLFYCNSLRDSSSFKRVYNGNELVTIFKDTATVMDVEEWPQDAEYRVKNLDYYSPLTGKESYPLNQKTLKNIQIVGSENIGGHQTTHLQTIVKSREKTDQMGFRTLSTQYDFWISKVDSIPVQYSIRYVLLEHKDTVVQYQLNTLTSFDLNGLKDTFLLSSESIASSYHIKPYVPYQRPELLQKGSVAPDWKLASLNGDSIQLSDLRGQVVLLDFFYTSCGPCVGAMPGLEKMHRDYSSKGLKIIAVDPYDDAEKLSAFFKKHDVTYTAVLDNKKTNKAYAVGGYPTVYILDRHGTIIYTQIGYGENTEKEMRKFIRKELRKRN